MQMADGKCVYVRFYAKKYNGKLIVRFDDTNPSKEREEFVENIQADLKKLNIVPDMVRLTIQKEREHR